MYELYITNKNYSSWSLRAWALMTELAIPFDERLVPMPMVLERSPFRAISPSGRVPCLHDGETRVWDTLAIAEYLAERHPGVWPADALTRAWARSASAEIHSGFEALKFHCSMNVGLRIRRDSIPHDLGANLERLEELWIDGLRRFGGPFLAGPRFTAVDAFHAPVAFRVQTYGLALGPAAADYVARALELGAMKKWYAAAIAERWRTVGHEAEARRAGEWIADLRAK